MPEAYGGVTVDYCLGQKLNANQDEEYAKWNTEGKNQGAEKYLPNSNLDSLPKWACDLPWASLFWSFCCGTLIIADKWKTLPASNGVICFSALTQKWQQRKHTLCSTEFHYCEANLQDLNPHWLAALHVHASFFLSQLHFLHSNTWILCLYLYSNFCIK